MMQSLSSVDLPAEFSLPRQPQTDRREPVRWVISHALHHWFLAVFLIIGAFGNAALAALVPIYIGQAFNAILASPPLIQLLVRLALLIAVSQIVRGFLQFLRNFGAELIAQRIERDIRHELYTSLLGKSMTFHSLQPVGDTMARATNDVREVNFMFSPGLNLVIGSANFMIMPLFLSARYHPALMITPALFVISYFMALWLYLKELGPITTQVRSSFGKLNSRLSEAIDGIETVKGMAQEKQEIRLFRFNADQFRKAFIRQGDVEARFLPLLLLGLAQAAGLLHSLLLYRWGLLDVGGVVAYFGLLQLFGFPTFVSLFSYSQISSGLAGARRILELINRETRLDQNVYGYAQPMRGEVEFHNVTFQYEEIGTNDSTLERVATPDGRFRQETEDGGGALKVLVSTEPVLQDISFRVRPGQTVAIVGQTGAGKTTLVKLINRTYDATRGEVLVDGISVRDWNLEALRRNVSMIEQDIFLFSRSIAENIAFGKPGATYEEIEEAAQAAQAHDFIMSFNEGYQTVIGERGVTLSGGQRQRIALARAFLTDPRILILDDSTSSIDSATEDRIQQAIYAAARGRTTFIITHRLSQIRWADTIIVLRKGKIEAIGSHDELMQSSPAYQRIFSE